MLEKFRVKLWSQTNKNTVFFALKSIFIKFNICLISFINFDRGGTSEPSVRLLQFYIGNAICTQDQRSVWNSVFLALGGLDKLANLVAARNFANSR